MIEKLPNAPFYVRNFAICLVKNRFILLSGGEEDGKVHAEVWMFDTISGEW